jgi:hypothetical protein
MPPGLRHALPLAPLGAVQSEFALQPHRPLTHAVPCEASGGSVQLLQVVPPVPQLLIDVPAWQVPLTLAVQQPLWHCVRLLPLVLSPLHAVPHWCVVVLHAWPTGQSLATLQAGQ